MLRFKNLAGVTAGALLSVSSFVAPVSAAGLTSVQISAIVNLLQSFNADASVIQNVQIALGGPPVGTPLIHTPFCVDLTQDLFLGSTDAKTFGAVSMLQQIVGVSPTGYFGPLTKAAVQKWQALHAVSATGYVGTNTRGALVCQPTVTPATSANTTPASTTLPTQTTTTATTSPYVANIPSLFASSSLPTAQTTSAVSQATKDQIIGVILAEQKMYASSDAAAMRTFLTNSTSDEPTLSNSYKAMTDDQISQLMPIMHSIAAGIPAETALRAPTTAWQVTDANATIQVGGTTVTLKKIGGVWY